MLMVNLKLSYCYNYIKLVNDKTKIKLLLQLHLNIELMTKHDLRLDMCFPYTVVIHSKSCLNKFYLLCFHLEVRTTSFQFPCLFYIATGSGSGSGNGCLSFR